MSYPTKLEVEHAGRYQLCKWYRFLHLAETSEEQDIMNMIVRRFNEVGGFTPEISKAIGW